MFSNLEILKGNYSKKPVRKIFTLIDIWITLVIFPCARGKIAREIQNWIRVKIFLAGFLE